MSESIESDESPDDPPEEEEEEKEEEETPPRRWKLGCAVFLLLFLWAVVGPWPVDETHPLRTPTGKVALERATTLARTIGPARDNEPVRIGWADTVITPRVGVPLAGYGKRGGRPSTGVLDDLHARAICLEAGAEPIVIVTTDLLMINRHLARSVHEAVSAERAIDRRQILFTASHTHCGSGGWSQTIGEWTVAGSFDQEAFDRLVDRLADVILRALRTRSPGALGWERLPAPTHIRNRTVPDGTVDPDLDCLVLEKKTGERGVLVIYGAHATCWGPDQMKFSGDYPGELVRRLTGKNGLAFAAFAAGAVGSHGPKGPKEAGEKARTMGRGLAGTVRRALKDASLKKRVDLAVGRVGLPLPELQIRLTDNLRISPHLARTQHDETTELQALRIDDHLWIATSFELSGMLSAPLKKKAAEAGLTLHITCFNGDYTGYIIPDEHYYGSSYEASMTFIGPHGGSYVSGIFEQLIRDVGESRD